MPVPKGTRIGGRQKGTPNKRTAERQIRLEETIKAVERALPSAFAGDSHAFLVAIYKNETLDLAIRLDAAKAAIAYEKPRLQAVEMKAEVNASIEVSQIELVAPSFESELTARQADLN